MRFSFNAFLTFSTIPMFARTAVVMAAWTSTRLTEAQSFVQQGGKLIGTGAVGSAFQGTGVALSADGNTAIVGGLLDNKGVGAAWVYTRSGGTWSQQGSKLLGTGGTGTVFLQGISVALSADGNTAAVGGTGDNGLFADARGGTSGRCTTASEPDRRR